MLNFVSRFMVAQPYFETFEEARVRVIGLRDISWEYGVWYRIRV
jgi:hypothetical protein